MRLEIDRRLLAPKLFYYGGMAALTPFLTLHYQGVGLSGKEIGILIGLGPLVHILCGSGAFVTWESSQASEKGR